MQIITSWHEKGKIEGKIEDIYKFMIPLLDFDNFQNILDIRQMQRPLT